MSHRRQFGFSLIELMIAMVLGVLVAAGIVSIFLSTSSSNRAQTQLARLQEEGRFAITRISSDLAAANSQYCTNTGGNAHLGTGGVYIDGLRAPTIYAVGKLMNAMYDLTTPWGASAGGTYPSEPTTAYSLPSFLSMRGYDCTTTACTPVDPSYVGIPAQGTTAGKRVLGSSVITLRYLKPGSGWTIYPSGSASGSTLITNAADSSLAQINLAPTSTEPPVTNFQPGDLALLANCSSAQVFAITGQGSGTLVPMGVGTTAGYNFALPTGQQGTAAPMLFDLNRDYQTVTYYLEVVPSGDGITTTGALMRRVNGNNASEGGREDELVRGIERLDFKYGVEYPDGTTRFLSAADVDASTSGTPGCTSQVPNPADTIDKGCLWRAVKSIEVDLLMDGQVPLYTLTPGELEYTYATDGLTTPSAPGDAARKVTPAQQGFVNPLLRREFTALVSLRNFNP